MGRAMFSKVVIFAVAVILAAPICAAGGGGSGWGDCAGVDAEWSIRDFLRGVAEGGGDGIYATFFSVVV